MSTHQESFFVYGSFYKGLVHYHKIADYIVSSQPAMTGKGSVYRLEVGYPVYLLDGQDNVAGLWVQLEGPDLLFKVLDEFHGYNPITPDKSLFWRKAIDVHTQDGKTLSAQVYVLNPSKLPRTAQRIPEGLWQQNIAETPVLPAQLTARQRAYISKLGSTRGRDIVPIDLNLYRELMKLDLIVDKGRRLALTKLGKEVWRYLPIEAEDEGA